MSDDLFTDDAYATLRPAQREHLAKLLGRIHNEEMKAAVEVVFWMGLHDLNELRLIVQGDLQLYKADFLREIEGIRNDLNQRTQTLEAGIMVAERLAEVRVDELLPAVQALVADVRALREVVGTLPEQDSRPLMTRQVEASKERRSIRVGLFATAAACAVALVIGLVNLYIELSWLAPAIFHNTLGG